MSAPLLVELFTEELPPRALRQLGDAFGTALQRELAKRDFLEKNATLTVFATPRRLAARLTGVLARSPAKQFEERLLPAKVGLDANGQPTPALLKKLTALGLDATVMKDAVTRSDGKLDMLFLPRVAEGQALQTALQAAIEEAVGALPIPKVMTYQLSDRVTSVKFVRPAHGLVALHGADVVNVSVLGLTAGRTTHGHRFLGRQDIDLSNADEYESRLLGEGMVVASFDDRRAVIEKALNGQASTLGATLGDFGALLDEVTALVEWPVVYVADFDQEFLEVPQECLILTMRTNQKYFPLFGKDGRLTGRFLVVSNMKVDDPKNIIDGNRRVVRPRLADARFFYDQDRRSRLETRVPMLANVVYHNKLGTQLERVERVQLICGRIARMLGEDPLLAERAAWLAKADLLTGMVGEFPELQGIMGRYYARHDGEPETVADAIEAHYHPRFAGDTLPQTGVARALALADKLETIAGMFLIGQQPTGDKDPFALRRHALGIVRILVECDLPLELPALLSAAVEAFRKPDGTQAIAAIETFVYDRMKAYFADAGYSTLEIDAVLALRPAAVHLVPRRLAAVRQFAAMEEAPSLSAANKRIGNILKKADASAAKFDPARFAQPEEHALGAAYASARAESDRHFAARDYAKALGALASIRQAVDAYFDAVMVMADDVDLRNNRIAFLRELYEAFNRVADISRLAA